ncbi:MAG: UDP-N-acetylmuramate:L-alanyl-gamma-D-glutamyl-meso-diaminopimelate ligase, partial [Bdellovibrionales bacterium]|nr:UDP-N-acetylmuramate:L-alanyl-gamma-D-glutamyl-meso-diaminopimelate ligase [Bdellovibrionales bacterium]
ASLAGLLKEQGYDVSGSDQNVYPPMSTQLRELGIPLYEGYRAENLSKEIDLVIVGNVISKTNPEAVRLMELGLKYTSLPSAVGEFLIQDRDSYVISGTHGKTTTTSLLSWVATSCGVQPGFLVGGIPKNFEKSFQVPKGRVFVIEGDEYDTAYFDKVPKFVHYRPNFAILTSVEFDHADIYRDLDHVKDAFRMLLARIPVGGRLVACTDDAGVRSLLEGKQYAFDVQTYGEKTGDWRATEIEFLPEFCRFCVEHKGQKVASVAVPLFGRYNVVNALAVYVQARLSGWDEKKILEGFRSFQGVKRRQEIIGKPRGITVIEDFAHHPTAVQVTLEGIRERYRHHRIWGIFEPRSATSRRNIFQKDYISALGVADVSVVAGVFNKEGLDPSLRFEPEDLVSALKAEGKDAHFCPRTQDIVSLVKGGAEPGDVVVIMSNGGFDGIYQKLLAALES